MYRTLFHNINLLYTLSGGVRTKDTLNDPQVLQDAWIVEEDGIIIAIGNGELPKVDQMIDLNHQIVVPGFIDAHTHLVFSGDRVNEYAKKISGVSYLELLQAGGGILSTVLATRTASIQELTNKALITLAAMLKCGVTSLEAKSGYGLDQETELKQLQVIKDLQVVQPIELYPTYMPAHATPMEFSNSDHYIEWLLEEAIEQPIDMQLSKTMDCFLEQGVFNYDQCHRLLTAAKNIGYDVKLHIDEIANLGGADLACELDAISVEHCMVTNVEGAKRLANKQIPCVLLPATSFNLGKPFANAAMMKEQGVIMALATDYNPGSSPCSDFIWMMRIASRGLKLLPNEVLSMVTINAARVLRKEQLIGSLEVGKQADFIVLNVPSFDHVIADLGANPITAVYKKGIKVC
jgi:imidazolonepropionase